MDWFLYDRDLRHERVNVAVSLSCTFSMLQFYRIALFSSFAIFFFTFHVLFVMHFYKLFS